MFSSAAIHRAATASGFAVALFAPWLTTGTAQAQSATVSSSTAADPLSPSAPFSLTALWHQNNLLGDMGGLRSLLGQAGITFDLSETSEVLGNVSGGVKQGAAYDGVTQMSLQLDTSKALGWEGGTFNISALQLHGRNFSQYYLDNLQTDSGIAANPATRLWELWYQQAFLDDRFDIKIGQQSIDQEFMVSQNSNTFMNTMMGWPAVPSYDMPAGGPAFPLSAPGIRLRVTPTPAITVLGGVFNGDPTGGKSDTDGSGTFFSVHNGVLAIGEIQYAINQPATGDMVTTNAPPPGLPGTYKLGFWYNSNPFADQAIDDAGLSLADPASDGNPRLHRGNFSLYAVADQMVWRPDPQSTQSLNAFIRLMGAPDAQNALSFSANGGLTLKAPFDGRDDDTAGIGFGYVKVSPRLASYDSSLNAFGTPTITQGSETFVELTYQYQAAPWWQIQPDFQYTFNPGGGLLNPNNPAKRIGNEAVFGLRTVITF